MNEKIEYELEKDGSVELGAIRFEPVSEEDKIIALSDDRDAVTFERTENNRKACYDIFNKERTEFIGYLDMFYDLGGFLNYVESRQKKDGSYEKRASALTARKLFGMVNFPETRSEMTLALMRVANILHERNREYGGWQSIGNAGLPQRVSKPI